METASSDWNPRYASAC